jgi:hypothetical protein
MDSDSPVDPQDLAYIKQLIDLEKAGERCPVEVGPYSALAIIGALQLATHHPDMAPKTRQIIQSFYRQFYPLFEGTPGEEIVRKGEHPEWDV